MEPKTTPSNWTMFTGFGFGLFLTLVIFIAFGAAGFGWHLGVVAAIRWLGL